MAAVRQVLAAGLTGREGGPPRTLGAALGLATSFGAWQWVVRREGLDDAEAVEVLAAVVEAAAA